MLLQLLMLCHHHRSLLLQYSIKLSFLGAHRSLRLDQKRLDIFMVSFQSEFVCSTIIQSMVSSISEQYSYSSLMAVLTCQLKRRSLVNVDVSAMVQ